MSERYPDDATLLALTEDADTGVEYIPTGMSPYYLQFRRLVQRLALAAQRAGDLRVYQQGDLSLGVRPGRCFIAGAARSFAGATDIAVVADATTHVWLDTAGALATGTSGLPADRTTFVPLAQVVSGPSAITSISDLRGEAYLQAPNLGMLGMTATAGEVNQALDGINATVDAAALNTLTGGPDSTADQEHRHLFMTQDANSETYFTLVNNSSGASANIALALSLPYVLLDDLVLMINRSNGFLVQCYDGQTFNMVGAVPVQGLHEGALSATQTGRLLGAVPIDGVVTNVILSTGVNLVSSDSADGVTATASVNGTALTSTHPAITSAAGAGFRSTSQGDGTAAVVKTDGTQNVSRGDVLTFDLTRIANGTISNEASDIVVLVVVRVNQPE